MSRPSLDWSDAVEVSLWLADMRVALADADAVTRDALRPASRRELGPALARQNYADAHRRLVDLLDYATPLPPDADDGEPSDPAGCGGAGPVH